MGSLRGMTHARFQTILARQNPPKWGAEYEPAIKATREEAPSRSRPAQVWSELLGRYVSTLSAPERVVLALVLYCPKVFELQEQRMLPYLPAPHPLAGHPKAHGVLLPSMRGTIAVADSLGGLRFHPTLPPRDDESAVEPGCWIGDFLCFLEDDEGAYCVNLSVKQRRAGFESPQIEDTPKTNRIRAQQREYIRHKTEAVLYSDAGIPTHQLATEEIDRSVAANLSHLMLWQRRKHGFSETETASLIDNFNGGIDRGASPFEIMCGISASEGCTLDKIKTVFFQAIWNRRLRLDLFSICHLDQPMRPERRDVLDVYGTYFERGAA